MRLPRSRRGKTAIDVVIVEQPANPVTRIRITLGESDSPNKRNTDMDFTECENLIVLLQYQLAVARGEIKHDEEK